MGSLHLDTEEEPRRGASRANSVRFDESALLGHFAHGSRSSSDFFPTRTGSGLGSHPMTERSSSHKSEGRQSSNGQSTRLNSLHIDTRPPSLPNGNSSGPPPGLFLLGPLPSIIRCWLDANFSNDSLTYAAICTGSYQSYIQTKLASKLNLDDRGGFQSHDKKIRLNVFLPEAVFQQSSSQPGSPIPQLPVITVDFLIHDYPCPDESVQAVIGSDVLRLRNADILLSQDRLTLFDDRYKKVAVPLVRPENSNSYRNLITLPSLAHSKSLSVGADDNSSRPDTNDEAPDAIKTQLAQHRNLSVGKRSILSLETDVFPEKFAIPTHFPNLAVGESHETRHLESTGEQEVPATIPNGEMQAPDPPIEIGSDPPSMIDSGRVWGPWRREVDSSSRLDSSCSDAVVPPTHQRSGRGRGMKVLKPSRSSTSTRSTQSSNMTSLETSVYQQDGINNRSNQIQPADTGIGSFSRNSFSNGSRSPVQGVTNRSRPMNPVGGASAFGWLKSD